MRSPNFSVLSANMTSVAAVDTFNGLPAHPLLVHLVVVAVPVAAILAVLATIWPAARRRMGLAPSIAAAVALVATPLTTDAGEWLEARKGSSPLISRHAELGGQLIFWVAPLTVLLVAWWIAGTTTVATRLQSLPLSVPRIGAIVTAVAIVVVSIGSVVMVYRIGDSGSESVWHDGFRP
jgi:uncharacterized membrane protein